MSGRIWIALLLLAACGAAGFLLARDRGAAQPLGANAAPPVLQHAAAMPVEGAWPVDQAWSWSFPLPAGGKRGDTLALRVREKASAPTSNAPYVNLNLTRAMPASQAKREFGTGGMMPFEARPLPQPGRVTLQLVDLSAIGAVSARPGATLRVLGKFTLGGGTVPLAGEDLFLPPGHFAGSSIRGSADWADGELYLMTFYVQGEAQFFQYDVFLKLQTGAMPTAAGK